MNILSLEHQSMVIRLLCEGNSIRSTERITGRSRNTIMKLALQVGVACAELHDSMVRNVQAEVIEADEIWCFVGAKQGHLEDHHPEEFGDAYTFIAMDAHTKLVISYLTDKRTAGATCDFMDDLRARVVGRPQLSTDGFRPYVDAVEWAFGTDVNYAMHIKTYSTDSTQKDAAHRYSPGRVTGAEKLVVRGNPIPEQISTSYIERQNLSLRMMSRRFTRLTNGFSKRRESLRAAVALHFAFYNFVRIHESLRTTPAMAAGITNHVWTVEELVGFVLTLPMAA